MGFFKKFGKKAVATAKVGVRKFNNTAARVGSVADKVGAVAGKLSGVPIIGGAASAVAGVAKQVSSAASLAGGIGSRVAGGLQKADKAIKNPGGAARSFFEGGNSSRPPGVNPNVHASQGTVPMRSSQNMAIVPRR